MSYPGETVTIRSFKEALAIASNYIHVPSDEKLKKPAIPSYYELPPSAKRSIWEMTQEALCNTLEYIMEYLHHSCYMLCVKSNTSKMYKLEKYETANVYKKYIGNSLHHLEKNRTLSHANVQFIRKTLYGSQLRFMQCVVKKQYPGKESFATEYVDFIDKLELPDGVYILNLTDSVILRKDGKHPFPMVVGELDIGKYKERPFVPIFSLSGQKRYHDIPIPNYDDVMYVLGKSNVDFKSFETEWEKKETMAVFRGGPTGCGYTTATNSRLKLTTIKSKYLDVGITGKGYTVNTNSIRYDPIHGLGMLNTNIQSTREFLPMSEQSKRKYIIHVDGNVHAYRLLTTMATGSLILRVESEYTSWLEHVLKPYVHYIPIKKDLSDLEEKINKCIRNDDKCKEIAKNAMQLAVDVLEYSKLRNIFQYIVQNSGKNPQYIVTPVKPVTLILSLTKKRSVPSSSPFSPEYLEHDKTKKCPKGRERIKGTNICKRKTVKKIPKDMVVVEAAPSSPDEIELEAGKRCPKGRERVKGTTRCRTKSMKN